MGNTGSQPVMTAEERLALITRGLEPEDISNLEILKHILEEGKRNPKVAWMTAPTGKLHIGYFIPLLKLVDFLDAGCEITIKLADLYSFMTNVEHPMEQVIYRMEYYKYTIAATLQALGVPASQVKFIQQSDYQFDKKCMMDQWRLCAIVSEEAAKEAAGGSYNPAMLSPLLGPGFQALAEEQLDIDVQLGGRDQAKIFAFADHFLPQLGYRNRTRMMNTMLLNLLGTKMSSSHPSNTKIRILDSPDVVVQKLAEAPWAGNNPDTNGILGILRYILIPAAELKARRCSLAHKEEIVVFSVEVNGKTVSFHSYDEIQEGLDQGLLDTTILKLGVGSALNILLEGVRVAYAGDKAWQAADRNGYLDDA